MDQILPILKIIGAYALLVVCSPAIPWILSLGLLFYGRARVRRLQRAAQQRHKQLETELKTLVLTTRRLEDLMLDAERRLQESEQRSSQLVPPPTSRSGLNLTKRSQAARMLRRGDQPEQIAATLCLPRNEVDLLLKIQKTAAAG